MHRWRKHFCVRFLNKIPLRKAVFIFCATHPNGILTRRRFMTHTASRLAHATGALKTNDLARITVDTTVQPKNVTHPTDAKLMLTAIAKLGALAKAQGLPVPSENRIRRRIRSEE